MHEIYFYYVYFCGILFVVMKSETTQKTAKVSKTESYRETSVSTSNMLRGYALAAIVSGYILGPLLILGGGAYWMYTMGIIPKGVVIVVVLVSFVISNALIITRSSKLITNFNKKADIVDPTAEEVAQWNANRPSSYQYDDEEEEDENY